MESNHPSGGLLRPAGFEAELIRLHEQPHGLREAGHTEAANALAQKLTAQKAVGALPEPEPGICTMRQAFAEDEESGWSKRDRRRNRARKGGDDGEG